MTPKPKCKCKMPSYEAELELDGHDDPPSLPKTKIIAQQNLSLFIYSLSNIWYHSDSVSRLK